MVYLVIPPIIIVVSIGLLVLLLARRARTVDFAVAEPREKQSADESASTNEILQQNRKYKKSEDGESSDFSNNVGEQIFQQQKKSPFAQGLQRLKGKFRKDRTQGIHTSSDDDHHNGMSQVQHTAVEQSTLSFIRRRMLLQEQRRNPVSDQDVDISHDGTQNKNLYDEHESVLIAAVAEDPNDITSYTQLGMYYVEKHSYDDARQCFKQILKLQPRNRQAQLMMKKLDQVSL